jgi:hypothetical protein
MERRPDGRAGLRRTPVEDELRNSGTKVARDELKGGFGTMQDITERK